MVSYVNHKGRASEREGEKERSKIEAKTRDFFDYIKSESIISNWIIVLYFRIILPYTHTAIQLSNKAILFNSDTKSMFIVI